MSSLPSRPSQIRQDQRATVPLLCARNAWYDASTSRQDKRPVLSSKRQRKVTSFARAVTLSNEAEDRITSRASIRFRFRFSSTRQLARCVNGESNCATICLLACAWFFYLVFVETSVIVDHSLWTKCVCNRSLTFAPYIHSRVSQTFHSARLTCVTLPDLESIAFQAGLLSQR